MAADVHQTPVTALEAVAGRRSIRRFRDTPVDDQVVRQILKLASRAPSGTNSQPWKVYVVTGDARAAVSTSVIAAATAGERREEYPYAPSWWEPYKARQRKVGFDLYAAYGVQREDREGRRRAAFRNFEFFGAPVGLFFTMDNRLLYGSWLDSGIFIGNVTVAARGFGLDTCAQQIWCEYGPTVHRTVGIPDDEILLCGMSLGYSVPGAPENLMKTERVAVEDFVRFNS